MTLFLGLLSLVQVLLLPGLIVSSRLNRLSWVDRVLLALPLSLVLNHLLVVGLVLVGYYHQSVLLAIFLCELVTLTIFIYFTKKNEGLLIQSLKPWVSKSDSWGMSVSKALLVVALTLCAINLVLLVNQHIGAVFAGWDAVVSWNRWAVDWFHQAYPAATASYPYGTYTYPQLLPTLYSLTYVFVGDYRIEQFAILVVAAFPLFSLITFLRLAELLQTGRIAVYAGVIIFFGIFSSDFFGGGYQFSGYAETPLAYFSIAAMYGFLLVRRVELQNPGKATWLIIWTCVITAGAALLKQNGILIALGYPLALYYYGLEKQANAKSLLLYMLALVMLIVLPWYIYKAVDIIKLRDAVIWGAYSDPIQQVKWYARPYDGLFQVFNQIGWWWLVLFIIGLRDHNGRRFALWVVLPLYCFWALILSYDLRGLTAALPAIALVMGYGVQTVYQRVRNPVLSVLVLVFICVTLIQKLSYNYTLIYQPSHDMTWVMPVLLAFIIICIWQVALNHSVLIGRQNEGFVALIRSMPFWVPTIMIIVIALSLPLKSVDLLNQAIEKKSLIGESSINIFLRDFLAKHPDGGQVGTAYQMMGFVPGISERFQMVQCSTKQQFLSGIALDRVGYIMLMPGCPKEDYDFMARAVERGAFHLLFEQSGYRFYDIVGNSELIRLLRSSSIIGRNSVGGESLFTTTSVPMQVVSDNGGYIESVKLETHGIVISGWSVSGSKVQPSDWVLALVGDRLMLLTDVGEDRPNAEKMLASKEARLSGFTLHLPTVRLNDAEGAIRLFGLHTGSLYELKIHDDVHITKELSNLGLEIRAGRLYLHHPGRLSLPQLVQ